MRISASLLCIWSCASLAHAQCTSPEWSTEFPLGISGVAFGMTVLDIDGPGPQAAALYFGGNLQNIGGVPMPGVARWNGRTWQGIPNAPNAVTAIGSFDPDGPGPALASLVVQWSDSVGSRVSVWNGTTWSALGTLPRFSHATGGFATLDPDGPGPAPPELWMAGSFSDESQTAHYPAIRWDGQEWRSPIGGEQFYEANAIAAYDEDGPGPLPDRIFVTTPGGLGVYTWDDGQWRIVGGGIFRSGFYLCNALRVIDEDGSGPQRPTLWVGGSFTRAGAVSAFNVARWDGVAWSAIGGGIGPAIPYTTEIQDFQAVDHSGGFGPPTIYAVGWGNPSGVFRWNPASQEWSLAGQTQLLPPMLQISLAAFKGGEQTESLYAAGTFFPTMGGVPAQGLARLKCPSCYPNCDGSQGPSVLTPNDFSCFITKFIAQDPYAECDGANGLTANDFMCFLTRFAAGCT